MSTANPTKTDRDFEVNDQEIGESSILAALGRALDENLKEVMPDSWAGHERLAADDYPYQGNGSCSETVSKRPVDVSSDNQTK